MSRLARNCLAALSMVAALGLIPTAPAAPVQWTVAEGGNGHWYEAVYIPERIEWEAAKAAAEAVPGHYLATATSALENQFIFSLVEDPKFWWGPFNGVENALFGPWLGGFQDPDAAEPADGWQWVTGEPWSFTAWGLGEPNNSYDEDLLHFAHRTDGPEWNDFKPNYGGMNGYVVEFPEPATLGALLFGGLALFRRR